MNAWYASAWMPYLRAPGSQALTDAMREQLQRRALLRSLDATVFLETELVNPVAAWIAAGGSSPVLFSATDQRKARRLFSEEEAHALAAAHLRSKAMLPGYTSRRPAFAARIEATVTASGLPPEIAGYLIAIVTETTLSARLSEHMQAPELRPDVRKVLADHARDERWHAAFFTQCAQRHLSRGRRLRDTALRLLPQLVADYTDPDLDALAVDLRAVGVDGPSARTILRWLGARTPELRVPHLARLQQVFEPALEVL